MPLAAAGPSGLEPRFGCQPLLTVTSLEGGLARSLGQATLPLGCHTSEVWQSSHSQSCLGVPESDVAFARRLPPQCTTAALRPQLLFTLQRPSRSWGRAPCTPAPRTEPAQHSVRKQICQEIPLALKKK